METTAGSWRKQNSFLFLRCHCHNLECNEAQFISSWPSTQKTGKQCKAVLGDEGLLLTVPPLCTIEMLSQQQASAKPEIPPKASACTRTQELNLCVATHAWDMSRGSPQSLLLGGTHLVFLSSPCEPVKLCYSCVMEEGECFWGGQGRSRT